MSFAISGGVWAELGLAGQSIRKFMILQGRWLAGRQSIRLFMIFVDRSWPEHKEIYDFKERWQAARQSIRKFMILKRDPGQSIRKIMILKRDGWSHRWQVVQSLPPQV